MKIKTEICADGEEEIIIRCRSMSDRIKRIEDILEDIVMSEKEMVLHLSGTEYYVPIQDILFFEALDGKIYAHTKDKIFTCEYKLFELERLLPSSFVRISKSNIANIMLIAFLRREIVGNGEIGFKDCEKRTYFSRSYYKILRDKIDEMRLEK